jgi:cytochrome c oxidase subunit 4
MAHDHHHDHHGHGHEDDGGVHVHVHPISLYYKVFGALIFFTLLTVAVAEVHLGPWNFFVAVAIATIKATLVALFFMHLKDDARFNALIFVGSLVFMGVFFVYTMNDTSYRGQWDEANGTKVLSSTGAPAPGGCAVAACADHAAPAGEHAAEGHGEGHAEPAAHH